MLDRWKIISKRKFLIFKIDKFQYELSFNKELFFFYYNKFIK